MNIYGSLMNIYGSLMNIYDAKNKDIYVEKNKRHLCRKEQKTFMSKRTKDIYDEKQIFLTKNIFIYDFPKREAQQNAR